nr:unnamed protein product [Callosobruchus analis]
MAKEIYRWKGWLLSALENLRSRKMYNFDGRSIFICNRSTPPCLERSPEELAILLDFSGAIGLINQDKMEHSGERLLKIHGSVIKGSVITIIQQLGYSKVCPRWVPRMLTDQNKEARKTIASQHLQRFRLEGDEFLKKIVTGDETWVPETFLNILYLLGEFAKSGRWGGKLIGKLLQLFVETLQERLTPEIINKKPDGAYGRSFPSYSVVKEWAKCFQMGQELLEDDSGGNYGVALVEELVLSDRRLKTTSPEPYYLLFIRYSW